MRMTTDGVLTGYESICAAIHMGPACRTHDDLMQKHPVYLVAYNQRLIDYRNGLVQGAHTLHG